MSASPTPPVPSQPQQQAPTAFKPNYDILSSMNSSRPVSQSPTPVMGVSSQAQSTATPPPAADPFASLVSASPRATSSPFQPPAQSQPAPASSSLLDLVGDTGPSPQPARQAAPVEDDEWDFASALPASNALPSTNKIQVLNSQLRVDFAARRVPNQTRQIHIVAIFSNTTTQSIGDLHFQVAVEKVSHLPLFNTVHFLDEFTDN